MNHSTGSKKLVSVLAVGWESEVRAVSNLEHCHLYHRSTVVTFLDMRAGFDLMARTALWRCLLMTLNIRKVRCHITLAPPLRQGGTFMASFIHLLLLIVANDSAVLYPLHFNFAIKDILSEPMTSCQNVDLLLLRSK